MTPLGERGVACRVWVWKPERRRPLGRLRCTWEDNIKMGIKSVVTACTGLTWLGMGTDGGLS